MEVQVIWNYRSFAGYPWLMSGYGGVTTREQPGDCIVTAQLGVDTIAILYFAQARKMRQLQKWNIFFWMDLQF